MREEPSIENTPAPKPRTTQEIRTKLLESFKAAGHIIITVPVTQRRKGWQDVPRFLEMLDKFETGSAKTKHRVN